MAELIDGLLYRTDALNQDVQRDVLEVLAALSFQRDVFRGKPMRREWAQFGYSYKASSRQLVPAAPIPEWANNTAALAANALGVRFQPDQVIVTRYAPGAGIGWHIDHKQFGDLIVGVSLLGSATMEFREHQDRGLPPMTLVLSPGSVYAIHGIARWNFAHRIRAVPSTRYSLTFRTIDCLPPPRG
jgi:alkylated DNA repair dioxygenase AlkB